MKRIRCACGHFKSSHYDYVKSNRYGCHAVDKATGVSLKCPCLKDQGDVQYADKKCEVSQ